MKTAFGITWRQSDHEPRTGRLAIEPTALVLTTIEPAARREVPLDEIVAVEVKSSADSGSATVVLQSSAGDIVELGTSVDRWIVAELVEHLFTRGLNLRGRRRILVSVKLRPGAHDTVRKLLRGGPPFDPAKTPLTLHEVFLLGDMSALTIESLLVAEEPVVHWRFEQLEAAGYPPGEASKLSERADVDLHVAVRLLDGGCPVSTALSILL